MEKKAVKVTCSKIGNISKMLPIIFCNPFFK